MKGFCVLAVKHHYLGSCHHIISLYLQVVSYFSEVKAEGERQCIPRQHPDLQRG